MYNRRGRLILGGFKKTLLYSEYNQYIEFEVTAGSVTNMRPILLIAPIRTSYSQN